MSLEDIGKFVDLCQFPAQTPPNGTLSNFDNPKSLQSTTIGLGVTTTALAAIFTIGRIYVNWRKLRLADYFVASGAILSIAYTGLTISYSKYARHQWDVPACWFNGEYVKFLYAQLTLSGPTACIPKCAILLVYLQFFSIHRPMRFAVYFGLLATAGTYLPSIPIAAYFGAPRPGQTWISMYQTQRLYQEAYYGMVVGVLGAALDIYIFVLPLPILWNLHMDRPKRIQLFGVFGTAFIGVTASVVALVYRVRLLNLVDSPNDATYIQFCNFIAAIIEINVANIVASMPAFAGFVRRYIASSSFLQALKMRIHSSSSSRNQSPRWPSRNSTQKSSTGAFKPPVSRSDYCELGELGPTFTESQVYGNGPVPPQARCHCILRQTEIVQLSTPNSVDKLV